MQAPPRSGMNNNNDDDRTTDPTILEFRERERRHRTFRVLLMFLLMLLLMEDEDQQNGRGYEAHHQSNMNNMWGRHPNPNDPENPNNNSNNNNNNNKRHSHLRRNNNNHHHRSWSNNNDADATASLASFGTTSTSTTTTATPWLSPTVWEKRMAQERQLQWYTQHHDRYQTLVQRNGGQRVELDIQLWLQQIVQAGRRRQQQQQQQQQRVSSNNATVVTTAQPDKDDEAVPVVARESDLWWWGLGADGHDHDNNHPMTASERQEAAQSEQQKRIWHYPWNATGFYRGKWTQLPLPATTTTTTSTTTNTVEDAAATIGAVSSKQQTALPASTIPAASAANQNHNSSSSAHKNASMLTTVLAAKELEPILLEYAKRQQQQQPAIPSSSSKSSSLSERPKPAATSSSSSTPTNGLEVGVYWIPPGLAVQMRDDHNLTQRQWDEMTMDHSGTLYPPSSYSTSTTKVSLTRRGIVAREMTETTTDQTITTTTTKPSLPLTRSEGRAAIQLYSRPIPGMQEMSLVDGFIKLYNGPYVFGNSAAASSSSTSAYATTATSKNDVLLRVRGILLHQIGQLSLVSSTNVPSCQSALVLPPPKSKPRTTTTTTNPQPAQRVLRQTVSPAILLASSATTTGEEGTDGHPNPEDNTEDKLAATAVDESAATNLDESSSHRLTPTATTTDAMIDNKVEKEDTTVTASEPKDDKSPAASRRRLQEAVSTSHGGDWNQADLESLVRDAESLVAATEADSSSFSSSSWKPLYSSLESHRRKLSTAPKDEAKEQNNDNVESSRSSDSPRPALPPWSDIVIPYPYVYDDEDERVRRTRTPGSRRMPPREQALESNAMACPFRISLNVQETEWTLGEYRTLLKRKWNERKLLNPSNPVHKWAPMNNKNNNKNNSNNNGTATELPTNNNDDKRKRTTTFFPGSSSSTTPYRSSKKKRRNLQDEDLVIHMVGTIYSEECNFAASVNVTALRTDWDAATKRAINYSFYMMLVCMVQIVLLLRQLLHSQTQSAATRVSMICIGWQTVLDALICLGHIYLCLAMQPLFTAFASVAFFKCLIFCVIEMKYMAIIIQARNSANGGQPTDVLRRQVAILHLRFYLALLVIFLLLFNMGEEYRLVYILGLYSFWVPQIILNVVTEAKTPMHKHYVYGMSVTRLVVPLYVYGVRNNFLREVYPETPYDPLTCQWVVLWVAVQTAILLGQGKYGARFWIPARFLPPKYDYSRPIPPAILNRARQHQEQTTTTEETVVVPAVTAATDTSTATTERQPLQPQFHATSVTTRNRSRKQSNKASDGNSSNGNHGIGSGGSPLGALTRRSSSTEGSKRRKNSITPATTTTTTTSVNNNKSMTTTTTTITPCSPELLLSSSSASSSALDCSICYETIDVVRQSYMLAPCDHLFHRDCLMQWMDVKMECPICRTDLPPL